MSNPRKQTLTGLLVLLGLFTLSALLIFLERPTGSVDGTLLGEDGKPLAGAQVVMESYPFEYQGLTDKAGFFHISQIPVGKYYPRIAKKGYERIYLPEHIVEEGRTAHLPPQPLVPLPPRLFVDLWDTNKIPGEKLSLSINGAKVAKINFSVYRIDLLEFLKAGLRLSDLAADTALPGYFQKQKPIAQWEFPIPEADVPEFDLKAPLKKAEQAWAFDTGLYLIHGEAGSVDRSKVFLTNTLLNRTDLGFILKRGATQNLLFVSTLSEPKPVAAAQVYSFPEGGEPQQTQTDENGIAQVPHGSGGAPDFVVAVSPQGTAYTFAPGEPYGGEAGAGSPIGEGEGEGEEEGGGSSGKGVFTFLYSDRPLYRPAQRVFLKGLARARNAAGVYDPISPQTVQLTVEDPRGTLISEQALNMESDGSFSTSLLLPDEAELGYYQVRADLAGREYTYSFEVDEYRKPEFKIDINGAKPQYYAGDDITFLIDAQYFFGAPVEANIEWFLYRSNYFYMPPGEGYLDDYMSEFEGEGEEGIGGYGEYMTEGKLKTDAQGHATVSYSTKEGTDDYQYTLLIHAKDVSDQEIQREGSLTVTAGDFYFRTERSSFLAFPKQPFSLTVLSKTYQDQPVARDYKIEVKRQYWDGIAKQYDYKKVDTIKGTTDAKGRGDSKITVTRGGYYQLLISGKDGAGRTVEYTDDLWVSGDGADSEDFGMAKEVKVIAEKRRFSAGDVAKFFVVGPEKNGRVLLTVEGQDLYQNQIITLDGFSKEVQIPLAKEWIPNVFIEATAIGKKDYYYGEAEVAISPEDHFLKVAVTSDKDKYQPGEPITYHISTQDAAGKPVPAAFSLGVVDEKIYALKSDKTDIKDFFWGARPNQVGTAYSFSGYYSGGIAKEDRNLLRRNFKDTAYWSAYVETNDQGQAQLTFNLPDNLTTWRATVIASTLTTTVGQETQKIIATKPLIARLATPRFFTEKDVVYLKAMIHNYTETEQSLQVSLGLEGLSFVEPSDEKTRTLTIAPKEVGSFTYAVLAKDPGNAKVQLLAKNTQVSDGVELAIPILPYGIADHQYAQGEIAAGLNGPGNQTVSLALPPDSAPNRSSLSVTLDSSFVGQLLGPLDYLVDYPYGCVEQTMSRLLPALQVATLAKELGLSDPNLEKKIPKVIERGLARIGRMQNAQGGWGWWMNDEADPFMTAYALYGLIQAQRLGQKIPEPTLEQGRTALGEILKKGVDEANTYLLGKEGTRYFIYYTAALAGLKPNVPSARGQPLSSPLAQALLALTLLEQNRTADADIILQQLEQRALCEQGKCSLSEKPQDYLDRSVMASAWTLKALIQSHSANTYLKDGLARWLMEQREGGHWRQTLDTATALYALSAYARDLPGSMEGVEAELQWNGKPLDSIAVASPHFVRRIQGCDPQDKDCQGNKKLPLAVGKQSLNILNPREHPLYYSTDFLAWSKAEQLSAVDQGIRIKREYVVLKGKKGDRYEAKALSGEIQKGELVGVRLTIETGKDLHYLMIEDPLPSGFEVVKGIAFDEQPAYSTDQSVRDEKITFFRTELKAGTYVMNYALLPELAGTFYVLPTVASEMYQPEVRGSGAGEKLTVKE